MILQARCTPSLGATPGGLAWPDPKNPLRGVDPELVARLSTEADRRIGEMAALCEDGGPIRGQSARHLMLLVRLLAGSLRQFEREVEKAL